MSKWKHYFFEFLMLFIAVSAGFWVDNYREEQADKEFLKKQLEVFVQDFHNSSNLSPYMDQIKWQRESIFNLAYKIRNGEYLTLDSSFTSLFLNSENLYIDFYDDLMRIGDVYDHEGFRFVEDPQLIAFFLKFNDNQKKHEQVISNWIETVDQLEGKIDEYSLTIQLEYLFYKDTNSPWLEDFIFPQELKSGEFESGDFQGFISDPETILLINSMVRQLIVDQSLYYEIREQVNGILPQLESVIEEL